jgi:O-methyltransferase
VKSLQFLVTRDRAAVLRFLAARYPLPLSLADRLLLVRQFIRITDRARTYHTQAEMLQVVDHVFRRADRPGLTVLEAGCGKGGSTAKLSLAVRRAGGRLLVFDSFKGIPANDERHTNLYGKPVEFREGAFRGRLREVQRVVARLGAPEVCAWHKGWFADTMAGLTTPLDVVLLDVDLVASTRTCLVNLVPRLRPGGVVLTQDGHLRAVTDLLGNPTFWRDEIGVEPPEIRGIGERKLLELSFPAAGRS